MGILNNTEESDLPPIFTGNALDIKLPDIQIGKRPGGEPVFQSNTFISFPHWIFNVYLNDQEYEVLGENLQSGMPLGINGHFFPITKINKILYHGIEESPVGRPIEEGEIMPKLKINREFENDKQVWKILNKENNS